MLDTVRARKKSRLESREVAERFSPSAFQLETKTLGTSVVYPFTTQNLSKSGLLIRSGLSQIPFRENTLVELQFDPYDGVIGKSVSLTGRVVRRVDLDGGKVDLGISLIHDSSDMVAWNACVDQFEQGENPAEEMGDLPPREARISEKKYRHKTEPDF